MLAAGSMTPRQVWAMRLDEAIMLCEARSSLMRKARGESGSCRATPASPSGRSTIDHAGGRRTVRITTMDELYNAMKGVGI